MPSTYKPTKNSWFHSVRARIYWAILITVLPIVAILGYYIWLKYDDLLADSIDEAKSIVLSTVEHDHNLLNQAVEVLENIVNVPILRNENWRMCSSYMNQVISRSEKYRNMGVIQPNGDLVCTGQSDLRNLGTNLASREYFVKALRKINVTVSDYLPARLSTSPTIAIALRVPAYSGITAGIAYIILNLEYLNADNDWSELQPDSRLWVLDRNGTVLHSNSNGSTTPGDVLSDTKLDIKSLYETRYVDDNGNIWYSFVKPISILTEKNVLYVRYDVPKKVIYAQANEFLKFGIGSLVLLLLFAGSIAWILLQMAAGKSLDTLRQAVIRLAHHDLDTRVGHLLHGKELKEIGHQFDVMAETIQQSAISLQQSELGYRVLFESIPNPMLVFASDTGKIMAANDEANRLYGYTKDELIGLRLEDLRSSSAPSGLQKSFSNERHKRKDGKRLYVEVRHLFLDFRGESAQVLLIRDVTDRESLSHDLKARERLISNLFDSTVEAIYGLDATGYCIFANKSSARLLGYESPEDLIGKHFHTLAHYKHADGTPYLIEDCVIYKNLSKGLGAHVEGEVLWRRDGTCFPVEYWSYPVWKDEELDFCIVTFLDITDRVNQRKTLEFQAKHDSLTGLYNRTQIYQYVSDFIMTKPDKSMILVLGNIDNFKEVNEALGHDVGDSMLQCVADRLRKLLNTNTVLARIGSDEFVFVLVDQEISEAYAFVENVLRDMREPFNLAGLQIRISLSFGLVHYKAHADNAQDLFRFADITRRRAKKDSMGVAIYDVDYSVKTHEKLLLRGEILTALENNEFVLFLQPKIAINSKLFAKGNLIGFEALVRWKHPTRGLISPSVFIPIIEVSDLVHEFTSRVLDSAAKHCASMQSIYPGVCMSINVSVKNLLDKDFSNQIKSTLSKYNLAPYLLEIEVTESSLMADPDSALRILKTIHDLGVRVSIDDFGTGYSSFAYLTRLPIDILKIDQSFIIGMDEDEHKQAIVKSIIDMAHTLRIKVVAEGIEEKEVLSSLYAMNCDAGQGFYIAKPMLADDAYDWLKNNKEPLDF